jgi:ribonuclease P protein component
MLGKKNRLSKNKEFDKIWQNGRSGFDGFLGVKAIPNNLNLNRFGILVGLKVDKKAVGRNYLKRVLREAIRQLSPSLKKGFDIVIISLPAARGKKSEELKKSLIENLKKLKIWQ